MHVFSMSEKQSLAAIRSPDQCPEIYGEQILPRLAGHCQLNGQRISPPDFSGMMEYLDNQFLRHG